MVNDELDDAEEKFRVISSVLLKLVRYKLQVTGGRKR